ncbi:MAG: GNAT family N-acetyltransferase [Blautia sp.]|nr:GNAT family N-acetyltransferase [Blautia sp.]
MTKMIRKATELDIPSIVKIYNDILDREEAGKTHTGWKRDIYPSEASALEALEAGDLYVCERNHEILAAARINQCQVPAYEHAHWQYPASDEQVMVLHTLVVAPTRSGEGIGTSMIRFYEQHALAKNTPYLRMDTNEINTSAREFYKKLGFQEVGIVPCEFNGIEGVNLVCLEKKAERKMKRVGDSLTVQSHLLFPDSLNSNGRLFGGRLLSWIDETAGLVAKRHAECTCVTAAIDNMNFRAGAELGDTVYLKGYLTYVGRSSMEIRIDTYVEHLNGYRTLINNTHFVMVALDEDQKPTPVPGLIIENVNQQIEWENAKKRQSLRKQRDQEGY